jgi:hypothetical protein
MQCERRNSKLLTRHKSERCLKVVRKPRASADSTLPTFFEFEVNRGGPSQRHIAVGLMPSICRRPFEIPTQNTRYKIVRIRASENTCDEHMPTRVLHRDK